MPDPVKVGDVIDQKLWETVVCRKHCGCGHTWKGPFFLVWAKNPKNHVTIDGKICVRAKCDGCVAKYIELHDRADRMERIASVRRLYQQSKFKNERLGLARRLEILYGKARDRAANENERAEFHSKRGNARAIAKKLEEEVRADYENI